MSPASAHQPPRVALETTILAHGAPRHLALEWADAIESAVMAGGAAPATVGVHRGRAVVGMSRAKLESFLTESDIQKANCANLALMQALGKTAATTASATIELAADAGISIMATGAIGGVHRADHFDVSSDLIALTRFPVAVVCSGCKSILDVVSTREALETLGVPVIGWRSHRFPAFYLRDGGCDVDARFDDIAALASFIHEYMHSTGRGVVVANPIPESDAISPEHWNEWFTKARASVQHDGAGRNVTPRLLAALHELSGGATLRANLALVTANARLAGELARAATAR